MSEKTTRSIERPAIEEVIFYIDLLGTDIRKRKLTKAVNKFIEKKNKYNSSQTSFGIILFLEKENPVTVYDTNDSDHIIDIIKDSWKQREQEQSRFENGLFEILSYIFRKSRKETKVFRVIIISDTPSHRSEDYHKAVYELISKSKQFHTYIDILRIGDKKFYDDDIKLKIITSETQGGIFYCQTEEQFENIFLSLIKNKQEYNKIQPEDQVNILKEDKTFYEKMAAELISLEPDEEEKCNICQIDLCPICGAYSDEVHKCYNCGFKFHGCCAAQYSLTNNIGFNYIFKCPQCDTLLKLDEEFVEIVEEEMKEIYSEQNYQNTYESIGEEQSVKFEEPSQEASHVGENDTHMESIKEKSEIRMEATKNKYNYDDYEEENEEDRVKIIEEKPLETSQPPPGPPPSPQMMRKVKVGGFFGQEVALKSDQQNQSVISSQSQGNLSVKKAKAKTSITALRPPKLKNRTKIKLCQICGATVRNSNKCPQCGAKVE